MNTFDDSPETIRENVREFYARAAEGGGCGCAPSCCGPSAQTDPSEISGRLGYSAEDLASEAAAGNLGLGCGNPLAIASLRPGEVVLDLGSGGGFDSFLAARAVGPAGRVIGVDMTPAMLAKARQNAKVGQFTNVEFRLGEIENLPVSDKSVDAIISNCVINLSPDKARVFTESFRVLKPGGRLAISDIVALAPIPVELRNQVELYAGCATGASTVKELTRLLNAAGFAQVSIKPKAGAREVIQEWFPGRGIEDLITSATIEAVKPPR